VPAPSRLALAVTHAALAALAALATLAACGGGDRPAPAGEAGEDGGTLVIAVPAEPATLFPPRAQSTQEYAVMGAIFDRLAEIGPDLQTLGDAGFTPRLAESWTWSPDSLSIAFRLHPRARWHDGAPVRAGDVRFTFATYTAEEVASKDRALLVDNIDSVTVRDSLTAVFWFKRRKPQQFFDATYHMFILPAHLLDTVPRAALAAHPFGRAPVGTGRFRFARWEPAARLEVVSDTANARGRARLDRVVWTIARDYGAATVSLFAGEADLYENLQLDNLPQVAAAPTLRLLGNPQLSHTFVGFNTRAPKDRGAPHPVLGDAAVRRALAMAVDRERIVRAVFDSLGQVAIGPAPRALFPDPAALAPLPFDPARARALLDSAGWRDGNGDGVREREGRRLAFELLVPSTSAPRQRAALLVQEQLKSVGADVALRVLEISALVPRLDRRDFDAWMGAWTVNPGLQGLRTTWTTTARNNYQSWADAAFDAALDSALATFDPARHRALLVRAFQRAIDDAPSIWLFESRVPIALHRRLRPAPLRADAWHANLADWRVDPAERLDRDRIGVGGPR
jgi:peptide/nickel transport system substrate-binding protein